MASDRGELEPAHEFRLEGIGLVIGGGLLLAALVGAFYVGRWVERRAQPPRSASLDTGGPLAQVVDSEPDADAGDGLTYFDDLAGDEQQAEPQREAAAPARVPRPSAPAPPSTSEPSSPPPPAAAEGSFFVQVIALRDRQAAAASVDKLKRQGYPVRLFTEREGSGTLYKVGVGGYAAESEARAAATRLRSGGYPGAFVREME